MVWTDIPIKTGSEGLSGQSLERLGIFHQRNRERLPPVGKDIRLVLAGYLEGVAVSINVQVNKLIVRVGDLDLRAGEEPFGVVEKVIAVGIGHDGRPRSVDHHLDKAGLTPASGKIPVKSEISLHSSRVSSTHA